MIKFEILCTLFLELVKSLINIANMQSICDTNTEV